MLAFFFGLLIFGCKMSTPCLIDWDNPDTRKIIIAGAFVEGELQKRGKKGDELYYAPNLQAPYTGWAKTTYENGKVEFLKHYGKGKLDGLSTMWCKNGRRESLQTYRDGLHMKWHPSGKEKLREFYRNGQRDGPRVSWYENGQKEWEDHYQRGNLHGTSIEWYPNGKVEERLSYRDGKPDGTWIYFNPDGSERHRESYEMGESVE